MKWLAAVAALLTLSACGSTERVTRDEYGVCYEHYRSWDFGFQSADDTYRIKCPNEMQP